MRLREGTQLAHYEIAGLLGVGGMGEVYRATDTRLRREVAIKVLPEEFARDAERLGRFEREARVLASLNHPGIAAIYGFETAASPPFLAMEYVPGDTIDAVMAHGPIDIRDALGYAVQISEALECAHEKGVIHRDLKPANVKITPEGRIKVLDFGLAKALSDDPAPGATPISNSPTITMAATRAGVILGTAGYMSPEQARGKAIDKRADIWAFGCVLFEMLAGRRVFEGDTVPDVLSAVLRAEIDWSGLPPETPPLVRRLLRRCLERDLSRRMPDIRIARFDLEDAFSEPTGAPPRQPAARRWRLLWPAVAAVAVIAALALAVLHFGEVPPAAEMAQLDIALVEKTAFRSYISMSPDGRSVAFSAAAPERPYGLMIRTLDSVDMRPLPGSEDIGGGAAFWSPDSRWVAFWAGGKLKKLALGGGSPIPICDTPQVLGGAWRSDGAIVFGTFDRGLFLVNESGGTAVALTKVESGVYHLFPTFLPDKKHLIYLAAGTPQGNQLMVARLDGGTLKDPRVLMEAPTAPVYMPGADSRRGHLLYVRDGILLAQPFDAERRAIFGQPSAVADNVGSYLTRPYVSAAAGGKIVFFRGGPTPSNLQWFARDGTSEFMAAEARPYNSLDLSVDGSHVALESQFARGASHDIAVFDSTRGVMTRLTYDAGLDTNPVWSPDGRWIAFASNRAGRLDLYRKSASGAGPDELLLKTSADKRPFAWSADGRWLLYAEISSETKSDLWVLPMRDGAPAPNAKPEPYLRERANETQGQFSRDGKWIAYVSDESGSPQVYVQTFPTSGGKWQVSTAGAVQPRWSPDGNELFHIDANRTLWAAGITTTGTFRAAPPKVLFETRMLGGAGMFLFRYGVAGPNRFAIITGDNNVSVRSATMILNWRP